MFFKSRLRGFVIFVICLSILFNHVVICEEENISPDESEKFESLITLSDRIPTFPKLRGILPKLTKLTELISTPENTTKQHESADNSVKKESDEQIKESKGIEAIICQIAKSLDDGFAKINKRLNTLEKKINIIGVSKFREIKNEIRTFQNELNTSSDLTVKRIEEGINAVKHRVSDTHEQLLLLNDASSNKLKLLSDIQVNVDRSYSFLTQNMPQKGDLSDELQLMKADILLERKIDDKKNVENLQRFIEGFHKSVIIKNDSATTIPPTESTFTTAELPTCSKNQVYKPSFGQAIGEPDGSCNKPYEQSARSCAEIYAQTRGTCDGLYPVINYNNTHAIKSNVYCSDMQPFGDITQGWMVILRREENCFGEMCGSASVPLMQIATSFQHYVDGFGNETRGEYFLGLENIRRFTVNSPHSLQIDLEDESGGWVSFRYRNFRLECSPTYKFLFDEIELLSKQESNLRRETYNHLSHSLLSLNGSIFVSRESIDPKLFLVRDCLKSFNCDWWVKEDNFINLETSSCTYLTDVNLFAPFPTQAQQSLYWSNWASLYNSDRRITKVLMKIRPS